MSLCSAGAAVALPGHPTAIAVGFPDRVHSAERTAERPGFGQGSDCRSGSSPQKRITDAIILAIANQADGDARIALTLLDDVLHSTQGPYIYDRTAT